MPRELCTTTIPPACGLVDLESFMEAHFVAARGRVLPLDAEPWNLSWNTKRGTSRCEACGRLPRDGRLIGLRHRRAPAELFCCKLCALRLNQASREDIAAEAAKGEHPHTAEIERFIAAMRDLGNWTLPRPGVTVIRPVPNCTITLDGTGEGWRWRVEVDSQVERARWGASGHAWTIETAFSGAGWEARDLVAVAKLIEAQDAEQRHAEACEVADEVAWRAEVEDFRRLPAH